MHACSNSNRGTFNHECGKPACWIGTHADGHQQYFCLDCQKDGDEARGVNTWQPFDNPYGLHLPLFPMLYSWASNPITEDRIERTVERVIDRADIALMEGKATQDQYDRWNVALNSWVRGLYAQLA